MDVTQPEITVFTTVATGDLDPEDIELIRHQIERALKRLEWDDVTFHIDTEDLA